MPSNAILSRIVKNLIPVAVIRNIVWMNYKQFDTQKIKDYIQLHPDGIKVEDIIAHSGAEKLRVYPALFELEQEGWLTVTEREELGSPKRVRVK